MDAKVWWKSKQLWIGAIALAATFIQAKFGFVISPEYQGYMLSAVVVILRIVTKGPVTLTQ